MDYALTLDNTPEAVPAGTGILLLHPSTGETDRIDTAFLRTDTDALLIVSTRTTAREVQQKLEYYEVPAEQAFIIDTLSVERGYSRRASENVYYLSSPDDLSGIIDRTADFLEDTGGKRRITVDSVTELSFYAGTEETFDAVERILELLSAHDGVGLFHLAGEVHDEGTVERYRERFSAIIELRDDGSIASDFSGLESG